MPKYSIIIPVYNRPDEVDELLQSLTLQTYVDFEILIIEDGSKQRCEHVLSKYSDTLKISYFLKENSGQGFSRNYGFERAIGEWLVVFDSDCIIPSNYFELVEEFMRHNKIDAYGGPDKAHKDFSSVQKAISYSMTSVFTTGGIRGNKKRIGTFHPRSFNMGINREVFEKTGGYILPKKGEDLEFSIRIIDQGFKTALIEDAFVYHKRRTNFSQFYKQLHFFGTARINVFRFFKKELKVVHFFPFAFILGLLFFVCLLAFQTKLAFLGLIVYALYLFMIFVHATFITKSLKVGLLSVVAAFIQLTAYGIGFLKESIIFLKNG